ncbi:hypothetical protein SO694_00027399 [Aureococcus anophagefferens]|uniref:Uncharacterized protein n=1 Tax=Aureococcus anophagefferens TaxID=44056 RepID=A0ABR1FV22_AURAN
MPKPKAPSEAELLEACRAAKAAHPDFGVKRVYNHVAASKPEWRLTERRVQKRVSAPPSVWRRASWRTGRAPPGRRRRHGLVEKVDVAQAGVQWLAWGVGGREPPPAWSDAKDVAVLAPFAGLTRVGDHVRGAAPADDAAAAAAPRRRRPGGQRPRAPPPPPRTTRRPCRGAPAPRSCARRRAAPCAGPWPRPTAPRPPLASRRRRAVAVVSPLDLVRRQHLGEHDFLPNDFVIKRVDEKSDDDDDEPPAEDDGAVGVVRSSADAAADVRRRAGQG